MDAKFTKGPLKPIANHRGTGAYVYGPDEICRAEVLERLAGISHDECMANATLYAAAPDLYEALRLCLTELEERFDLESSSTNPGIKVAANEARAALAKAAN